MTAIAHPVYAFNGGELSPRLDGRADLPVYGRSVKRMQNVVALPHGPAVRRPGTLHRAAVKTSADAGLLLPFVVGRAAAYVIEAGDGYFRFYTADGRLEVTGTPVEVATPYADDELAGLSWVQSWDVLYLVHASHRPRQLVRAGATSFTLSAFANEDGPWLPANTTATTLTLGAVSGSTSVTADATTGINGGAGFQTSDIGRLIRFSQDGTTWTWLEITARTSTTVVTATVRGAAAAAVTATTYWQLGHWGGPEGWPAAVGLFQQRLWFAASGEQLNRIDASKSGDFTDFTPGSNDDDPISLTPDTDGVAAVRWFAARREVLLAGCDGSELAIGSGSAGPIAPSALLVEETTAHGSAAVKPAKLADRVLFVQAAGRKLREMRFLQETGWQAPDLSRQADHLLQAGLVQLAWQEEPWGILWACDAGGLLVGLTYDPESQVLAWHRHPLGGSGVAVESVAAIPTATGSQLWLLVRRTVNGATVRHVERLADFPDDDTAQVDQTYVDAALRYAGSATSSITGLGHLEGETVSVLTNLGVHPDVTVASGAVQLEWPVTAAVVGLACPARLRLARAQVALRLGASEGTKRRVHRLHVRLHRSGGLKAGATEEALSEVPERVAADPMDAAVPLFTGLRAVPFAGPNDYEGDVWLGADGPRPLNVVCLTADLEMAAG